MALNFELLVNEPPNPHPQPNEFHLRERTELGLTCWFLKINQSSISMEF